MFRFLLVTGLSACCAVHPIDWFPSLSPKAQKVQELLKEFDPMIDLALIDFQVPGMAIGVVVDGELVYSKGFGHRDVEQELPVTTDTLFPIGSCTKAFTSFLTGIFVDEGAIQWDSPLVDAIGELHLWDYDSTHHLSFRDVLTHRSGLPRHDFLWYNAKFDRDSLLKRLRYLEPMTRIRQKYLYNNLMYLLAGIGLERMSEKKWEDLIAEKILDPLEMKNTNFTISEMQLSNDYSVGYVEKHNRLQKMPFRDISLVGPAGSMNSNIEDLVCWVKMLLNHGEYNGKRLIQQATLQEMLVPQVITTGTSEAQDTHFSAYGIGWGITSYRGRYFISHDGINDGFTSVVGFLPNENVGIVILSNKNLTALPRYISLQMIDRILGLPFIDWIQQGLDGVQKSKASAQERQGKNDPTRKIGAQPTHSLEDYVGEYEHPAYGSLMIDLIDGKLRVLYNDIPYILEHWHYDVFRIAEEPEIPIVSLEGTKFTFRLDVHGEISEVAFPFEPSVKDIVFQRKQDQGHVSLHYLRKFIGVYEIYGYTIDVTVRGGVLCAMIPGQPIYELIPHEENEFRVKSKTGYNVRFVLNEAGTVAEVLLMQPYGTFSAKPKK